MTHIMFSDLQPSTLTAQGKLEFSKESGLKLEFHEKNLIDTINISQRIARILCNYGEVNNPNYVEKKKKKQTNRGRKPKIKNRINRKNQGNGKYFNSQITFWIASQDEDKPEKYYKIKLFRNGTIEIPGGLKPDMSDVRSAVEVVCDAVAECFVEDVQITKLYPIMRNYKFSLMDENNRVNIAKLYNIFTELKEMQDDLVKNITEIKYNIERYPGLIIKFATPIPRNEQKQTTIKMFHSGKVNIDGANTPECAHYYYQWICDFYNKYSDDIIYCPEEIASFSDSESGGD
jgi:hypothetical protein